MNIRLVLLIIIIACICITGNVFVARWVVPLLTVPLLDFVTIH